MLWTPLASPALADVQRLALYSGVLIACASWFATRQAVAMVEPGLAVGAVAVVGYGMSERFLPRLIHLPHSRLAFGRLEQPLTYWNAMGLLAALGLILCARLAGSPTRHLALRLAVTAAAPLLGAGLLLTLSRGGLLALAIGLLVLLALAREAAQPRALLVVLVAAALAGLTAAVLPGLDEVGPGASRSSGALLLVTVSLLGLGAAAVEWLLSSRAWDGATRPHRAIKSWRAALVALGATTVVVLTVAAVASDGKSERVDDSTGSVHRLGSLESARFTYWDVALASFVAQPLQGQGTASFPVALGRRFGSRATAHDAHSLYIETAGELGIVGLVLLGLTITGLAASTKRAIAFDPSMCAGSAAVLLAWAFHAGIDWDWEVPGVTLPALVCAGLLVAIGDRSRVVEAHAGDAELPA
jgi:hypothetical protein